MFGRRKKEAAREEVESARADARRFIAPGFLGRDEAADLLVEYLEDEPLDEETVRAVAAEVWDAVAAEQSHWQDEGDYARLAAAFAELEAAGFVTRMNFTCCQTCGHAEIGDEATGNETSYAFFHQQDAERLADPGAELYLAFGVLPRHPGIDQAVYARAVDGDEDARRALDPVFVSLEATVAAQIIAAAERQGLTVVRRDARSRPAILVPEWRKRLPV